LDCYRKGSDEEELGPIFCIKGQKSSLVIGQSEINPNPLHLEVGQILWNEFYIKQKHDLIWPKLVELGAPKMGGQFLDSRPMSNFK